MFAVEYCFLMSIRRFVYEVLPLLPCGTSKTGIKGCGIKEIVGGFRPLLLITTWLGIPESRKQDTPRSFRVQIWPAGFIKISQ
jgi:hypothetical protein